MSARVRRPSTARLELSGEDYLVVKKDLTAGEAREVRRAATLDPDAAGLALVLAYLLDWSFTDVNGSLLDIKSQPRDAVKAMLDALDEDAYQAVHQAIQKHAGDPRH